MVGRTTLVLAWILAVSPLVGCGRELREVIAEHKAKVEPQLARVAKLRDAAKAAPPVTVDDVRFDGPPPKYPSTEWDVDMTTNAAITYLEDLDDLVEWGNVPFRIEGSGSINRCASALATHREPYDPVLATLPPTPIAEHRAESYFKHCEGLRYLFVVRSLALAWPSPVTTGPCPEMPQSVDAGRDAGTDAGTAAGADAGATCKRFDGGLLRADVLVFDVRSGKQLGGFRFTAESSPRVDVSLDSQPDLAPGPDFRKQVRVAFVAAAAKAVPSVGIGD